MMSQVVKYRDCLWLCRLDSEIIKMEICTKLYPLFPYLFMFNAFHAAGECRRQVKNLTTFVIFFEIVEFHDHNIWSHHVKCIQKSTNMPGVGSLIREIDNNISEI